MGNMKFHGSSKPIIGHSAALTELMVDREPVPNIRFFNIR